VIGVVVIADTGAALQRLSQVVEDLPDVYIIRYCSGRGPVRAATAAAAPDVVLVDEMRWPRMTLTRIADIADGAPVVVCTSRPEARWLGDALRAGARAVVPYSVGATTLRHVMRDVLAAGDDASTDAALAA